MNREINKGDIVILSPGCSPGDIPKVSPGAIGIVVKKNSDEIAIKFSPATKLNVKEGVFVKIFLTGQLNKTKERINHN